MKNIEIIVLFLFFGSIAGDSWHVKILGSAGSTPIDQAIFVEYPYAYFGEGVYDISDPSRPFTKQAWWRKDTVTVRLRDIQVRNRRIFQTVLTDDGNGHYRQGFLISEFTGDSCFDLSFLQISNSADYVSGLYVQDSFAYVTSRDSGLYIINISNPQNPIQRGCFKTDGYAMGVFIVGNLAYVADDYNGLCIIDVSDPSHPQQIGHIKTNSYANNLFIVDILAYVADMWDGLRIINVADPTHPYEVGYYDTQGSARNVWVSKNLAYVADNHKGLRIIDVSKPIQPGEIGWFWKSDLVMCYDVCTSETLVYTIINDSLFVLQYSETGIKENNQKINSRNYQFATTPNPTGDFVKINFQIMKSDWVKITMYDNSGRLVRSLLNETKKSGNYAMAWDGKDESGRKVPSSVYFCRLQTDEFTAVRRLVLLR